MLVVLRNFELLIVEVLQNAVCQLYMTQVGMSELTFTASKLMSESTATVAALLSAELASRRNRVL